MTKNHLRWSRKQKKIYDCLIGGMKPAQIVGKHKLAFSSIGDVKRAIEKGETPYAVQPEVATGPKVKQTTMNSEAKELKAQVNKPRATVKGKEEPEEAPVVLASKAAVIKYRYNPTAVEVSPIMLNAMDYYVKVKGFPANGDWAGLIDKIFKEYFLSQGIILTPWYDINNPPSILPPSPARGESKGSDKEDSYDPALEQLVEKIAKRVVNKVREQK